MPTEVSANIGLSKCYLLAGEGEKTQQAVIEIAQVRKITQAEFDALVKGKPHVAHNSGENEWDTPEYILECSRSVLGGFDLDPASSEKANKMVKAEQIFIVDDDGLSKEWPIGRIWMNPPYSQPLCAQFCERFATAIERGSTGIALVNNATETKWFKRLASVATAICFPLGHVRFLDPDGNPGAPLQGQAIIYCGTEWGQFCEEFDGLGLTALVSRPWGVSE